MDVYSVHGGIKRGMPGKSAKMYWEKKSAKTAITRFSARLRIKSSFLRKYTHKWRNRAHRCSFRPIDWYHSHPPPPPVPLYSISLTIFFLSMPTVAQMKTRPQRWEEGGGVTNKLSEKFYIMYIFADQDILHIHRIPPFLWDHIYIGRPTLYSTLYVLSRVGSNWIDTKKFFRWSNVKNLLQIILALAKRYNWVKIDRQINTKIAIKKP